MTSQMFDITGKKAIVTGSTRGLGRGMAEGLMEAGCEVCIVGTSDKVFEVAQSYCEKGYDCKGVKADLGTVSYTHLDVYKRQPLPLTVLA